MKKRAIVYILIAAGMYVAAIFIANGKILYFWDPPTLALTPGVAILLLLTHFSPREMVNAFRCAGSGESTADELKKALLFFRTGRRLVLATGALASLLGFIMILCVWQSPDFNKDFGVYLGIGLLSILYALLLHVLIFVPFESAIEKKMK